MWVFIIAIQMAVISLVLAQDPSFYPQQQQEQQPLISITIQNSPLLSSTPQLLRDQTVLRRDDYTYTLGIGGHKIHTRAVTWNEARITCEEEGGHLAIINSIAEANAITEIFRNAEAITGSLVPDFASIGFHDLYSEGEYVTIHGESLVKAGFTRWARGQPDNSGAGGAENCGSFHKSGGLNDIGCAVKCGFICEIPVLA